MKNKCLLVFDVHDEHQRIIQDLTDNDWHSIIEGVNDEGKSGICNLPETTWWKEFETANQAYNEFLTIAGAHNIIRVFVSEFDNWRGMQGISMKHQREEQ